MRIGIIGLGYVGLSTALGFAELGNSVYGYEKDLEKQKKIRNGVMPIYEEEMQNILEKTLNNTFFPVETLEKLLEQTEAVYICVPTPAKDDGEIDLTFIYEVAKEIAEELRSINNTPVLIIKSTVVPGTTQTFKELVVKYSGKNPDIIEVAMVPEFLKQGSAYKDFINPDRIVLGVEKEGSKTELLLQEMYQSFSCPKIVVDLETAEFSKYASNSFLAMKISFANELANIIDSFNLQKENRNVNVDNIVKIMGLDKRISSYFLGAGPGYGGSCFPKDVKALTAFGRSVNKPFNILETVTKVNSTQAKQVLEQAKRLLGSLENKKIGILGLAFKPNTDDIRDAPSKEIIKLLLEENAELYAWDPKAEENMNIEYPSVKYQDTLEDLEKCNLDAGIIVTDWKELRDYFDSKEKLPYEIIDTRRIGIKTKFVIGNSRT